MREQTTAKHIYAIQTRDQNHEGPDVFVGPIQGKGLYSPIWGTISPVLLKFQKHSGTFVNVKDKTQKGARGEQVQMDLLA